MEELQNKWIKKIIDLQHNDGSWGKFHSMSKPTKEEPMNTESALRRLLALGLTKDHPAIQKVIFYMENCLLGKQIIPDRREKVLNWDAFESMMLATWIYIFDSDNVHAIKISKLWASIISKNFKNGFFDEAMYKQEYRKHIPILNKNERLIGISQFYMVNLLKNSLSQEIERAFIDYIINFPDGIYYIYDSKITDLPENFNSKKASHYISALEQLAGYSCAKEKLAFAVNWLETVKNEKDKWDMGPLVKDNIYFPISNSWKKAEDREKDCTNRVLRLLEKLKN